MPMKRFSILLLSLLLALGACQQAEDTRYFAPELCFEAAVYSVEAAQGGADVVITFSRAATVDFKIDLVITSGLQEGVQFTVPSHTLAVAKGATEARLHITLVDDEIWDESSSIDILLTPGERYTIDPAKTCATCVNISKHVVIPVLRLSIPEDMDVVNPYLAPTVTLCLEADKAPLTDLQVPLAVEGEGVDGVTITLPAGQTQVNCPLQISKIDQSGYDEVLTLSMSSQKGKYAVGTEGGSVSIRLYDPVPDFKPVFKTGAQAGDGYQWRQAIKTPAGEWEGNLAANVDVSAEGSAYIKSLRNMGTTYGPLSNEVGLHILRLCDFFPNLRTTSGDAILDYGRNNNTRGFSPADSLFRFVLDPGSATEGDLVLNRPRTFTAFTGDYAAWKDAWEADSKATGGNILASVSPIITGRIDVVLEKLEGRFNLADSQNTMLLTAWFSCNSDEFMNGVTDKYAVTREGEWWKVEYKLWPR